jgi:hypothetical protein
VSVIITGDIQVINMLNRIGTNLITQVINPELDSWSKDIETGFHSRQHRWEGTMIAKTKAYSITPEKKEVRVDVPYANRENERPGNKGRGKGTGHGTPHRYVEPTLQEQEPKHFDALVNKIMRFINSN